MNTDTKTHSVTKKIITGDLNENGDIIGYPKAHVYDETIKDQQKNGFRLVSETKTVIFKGKAKQTKFKLVFVKDIKYHGE